MKSPQPNKQGLKVANLYVPGAKLSKNQKDILERLEKLNEEQERVSRRYALDEDKMRIDEKYSRLRAPLIEEL